MLLSRSLCAHTPVSKLFKLCNGCKLHAELDACLKLIERQKLNSIELAVKLVKSQRHMKIDSMHKYAD